MVSAKRVAEIFGSRPVHALSIPAQEPTLVDVPSQLPDQAREWLRLVGLEQLYSHQAESLIAFSQGHDVMAITGTGSGKSLCYILPAFKACLDEPAARCLMLFPTKALAQDQLGKLEQLVPGNEILFSTYDGDTEKGHRAAIRRQANVILTNPDMVHVGMLPGHENWVRFFKSLRLIVIDEAHVYRGAFGGHMGWVIRRLLRLCEWHGSRPQVIASSATVSNPVALFEALCGREPTLIANDGGRRGERQVVVVEAASDEDSDVKGPNREAAELLAEAVTHGVKAMTFCRSRNSAELVMKMAREEINRLNGDPSWIDAYRGGYTAKERRLIEKRLFSGDLRGITTTTAMELGVDVGGLDLVIMNGYPGSRASFWQQSGRAGRGGRPGMAVMLAHSDPLEQYLAQRAHLLTNELEPTIASLWNPVIAAQQAKCACYERPISVGEASRLGLGATLEGLVASGEIQETAGMFYYPAYSVPARQVSIRSAESGSVKLMVGGSVIGEMETWRAMQYAHLGAVHLHRGEGYLVTRSDLMRGIVEMEPFAGNYYTQPIVQSVIESQADLKSEVAGDYRLSLEAVQVTSLVSGYRHVSLKGGCVIGEFALEPQTRTMDTVALRLSVAFGAVKGFEMETAAPAIHGVEHLLATVAPLVAGCDRRDMGSSWYAMSADRLEPTIYLFDLAAGGLGLAEECYAQSRRLLIQARDLVVSCPCQNGCPLCLLAPGCESRNELLSKSGAAAVLDGAVRSLGMA